MAIIYLRHAKKQNTPDIGAPVTEHFIGNIPLSLSSRFQLVGGAWVEPQPDGRDDDLSGLVGIVQTHQKLRLIDKVSGHVMKI